MNKLDKTLKYLWLTNGIIFLIWSYLSIYPHIYRLFKPKPAYKRSGVIVGKKLSEAREKGFELQAIKLESPRRIESNNYLIIPVSQKDYPNPQPSTQQMKSQARWRSTYYTQFGLFNNLIFMKEDGSDKHLLFKNKVVILSFSIPSKNIGDVIYYRIVDKDTNGDDRLDGSDEYSFYTSDLEGKHLEKFEIPAGRLRYIYPLQDTGDLIVLVTKDTDKNGQYSEYDSDFVYKLDLQSKNIEEIVDSKLIHKIREILQE